MKDVADQTRETHSVYMNDGGWCVIAKGHDIPADEARQIAAEHFGEDAGYITRDLYLSKQRNVKWCERYGNPCDFNGDWHTHFHALATGQAGAEWTEIRPPRKEAYRG